MTREDAIIYWKIMQQRIRFVVDFNEKREEPFDISETFEKLLEAIDTTLVVLCPISRERVEKMFPGCKHCAKQKAPFCYDGANDSVYISIGNGLAAIESDSWGFLVSYCPCCGRPLTDEAVKMVMERLEKENE